MKKIPMLLMITSFLFSHMEGKSINHSNSETGNNCFEQIILQDKGLSEMTLEFCKELDGNNETLNNESFPSNIKNLFIENSNDLDDQFLNEENMVESDPENSEIKLRNNAIYFTIAPDFGFWAIGGYYERMIYRWDAIGLFGRVGYQGWVILMASGGDAIIFQPGIITGKQARHFEAALGATYITSSENNEFVAPAISIGYRHQKPNKGFIFRTGIGYPDGIYLSMGIGF